MIFPPTEEDVRAWLARCILNASIRDVRKMNMVRAEVEADADRRRYLRNAKRRSRAKGLR